MRVSCSGGVSTWGANGWWSSLLLGVGNTGFAVVIPVVAGVCFFTGETSCQTDPPASPSVILPLEGWA